MSIVDFEPTGSTASRRLETMRAPRQGHGAKGGVDR